MVRVIVCPTQLQMNDFCDLLKTPDAPISKIVSVEGLMEKEVKEYFILFYFILLTFCVI